MQQERILNPPWLHSRDGSSKSSLSETANCSIINHTCSHQCQLDPGKSLVSQFHDIETWKSNFRCRSQNISCFLTQNCLKSWRSNDEIQIAFVWKYIAVQSCDSCPQNSQLTCCLQCLLKWEMKGSTASQPPSVVIFHQLQAICSLAPSKRAINAIPLSY